MKLINKDCEMTIVDPNGDCNSIIIKYYTVNPSRPLDAQQTLQVKNDDYIPIFLCEEKWNWDGRKYLKTEFKEVMLTKQRTQEVKRILRYINLDDPVYFSIFGLANYKAPVQFLGNGCSWIRPAPMAD